MEKKISKHTLDLRTAKVDWRDFPQKLIEELKIIPNNTLR